MAQKKLTSEQLIAIKWLALPKRGGKTKEEIAEICGVHRNTLLNWSKDPYFEAELKKEIVRATLDRLPEIFDAVPDIIIKDGNAAMFKTLLQTHGMLTDKLEIATDDKNTDMAAMQERIRQYKDRAKEE